MLRIFPLETSLFRAGDCLNDFLIKHLDTGKSTGTGATIKEGSIVAITSKVVSVAEGQLVKQDSVKSKRELVIREADCYLGEGGYGCELTIKHGILIPSAGIDESNSETGDYILFPKDPFQSAQKIYQFLRARFGLKELGVIITDSHTHPLRRGVTGIALAYWGFHAVKKFAGSPDLFGRELKFTYVNVADALAAAAVYTMGEANEQRPLALVEDASVDFSEFIDPSEIKIPLEQDLYRRLFERHLHESAWKVSS